MVKILPVHLSSSLAEKINSLVNASGVKVEGYWSKLFAKALAGQNIGNMFNFGGSGASSAASSEPVKKEEKPKEAAKPVVKEEPKE